MVIQSHIVKEGKLVSYEVWEAYIESLKKDVNRLITDEQEAIERIRPLLFNAIQSRLPKKKFGIFFSGGIDSTLIAYLCKKMEADFICYTVGIKGSQDLEESEKVAKKLRLNHVKKELSLEEVELLFTKLVTIIPQKAQNIVNLGVGAVVLAAIVLADKDNIDTFFSGLGSEEIFAGYKRHEDANDINEECWLGLKSTWDRDFQRDFALAQSTNSEFLTPFLDRELIIGSMEVDGDLKIKNKVKKHILRLVALDYGIPQEFSMRPKKAAQYGSNFDKAIMKLAKAKGFSYKREYLEYLSEHKQNNNDNK